MQLAKQDIRQLTDVQGRPHRHRATPGYDGTGFVEYSTVLDGQRRQLATSVNALAEELCKVSGQVA